MCVSAGTSSGRLTRLPKLDCYPIYRIENLFAKLSGGRSFIELDLSQAYLWVPLDKESRKLVVVNTHKGLYRYTRVPYGVSSAPEIFQRLMETVLQGSPNIIAYIDNILVTSAMDKEHLKTLSLDWNGLNYGHAKPSTNSCNLPSLSHKID